LRDARPTDREKRICVLLYGISTAWAPFSVPISILRGAARASGGAGSASDAGAGVAELGAD
jgi:hypothetical protein